MLRSTPSLLEQVQSHEEHQLFDALAGIPEGRAFLVAYTDFVTKHGHRGHQDRDIWYPRRKEDCLIDARALRLVVLSEATALPDDGRAALTKRREQRTQEVLSRLGARRYGAARKVSFKMLISYVHRLLLFRDDERPFSDLITMSKKEALAEVGRRVHERGLLDAPADFYFLGQDELYAVLADRHNPRITKAKIAARREVFLAAAKGNSVPDFQTDGSPIDVPADPLIPDGGYYQGKGISRGSAEGTARVVRSLDDIGRLDPGCILVCHSTDPGWAPAFGIIRGLVLEAGGMLSHGACLSREYGLPAIALSGAMTVLPDGARVRVDGDTGKVAVM